MRALYAATLAVAILLPAKPGTAADLDDATYGALNEALIAGHLLPRFADLAGATALLDATAERVCAAPDATGIEELRTAYNMTGDSWEHVAHLRFGPAELLMRAMRFSFWPDPKDATGGAVLERLEAGDPTMLTTDAIADGSVAAQGLPAFERLLYDEGADAAFLAGDEAAHFRCAYVVAIAGNLDVMAQGLHADWGSLPADGVESSGFAADLMRAGTDPDYYYRSQKDVTVELFKSLYTAVERVADRKLARPLGDTIETAMPRLAEAWRSERSIANIRIDIDNARSMYELAGGFGDAVAGPAGDAELDALMRRAFAQILATADSIEMSLQAAIADPAERLKIERLALETKALKAIMVQRLAPALGIPIGFNALDGD
ncbi:MAG: imelysin family protein [Dongiaceae bacterium]